MQWMALTIKHQTARQTIDWFEPLTLMMSNNISLYIVSDVVEKHILFLKTKVVERFLVNSSQLCATCLNRNNVWCLSSS